ncbi:MAG: hypothetical protein IKU60_02365 [Clostridia bacterium]|nr:hypothetical protein [Clostridia bacterium]
MLKRHKKIVDEYFRDATIWFYSTLGFIAFIVVLFVVLFLTEGPGESTQSVKPFVTVAVCFYMLYTGRNIFKLKHRSVKDLKNGEIATKKITVKKFGVDTRYNLAISRNKKKMTGRIKYGILDTEGNIYCLVRGKEKKLPDDYIEGKTITVTYLENSKLVLEIAFDLRDDIDPGMDLFKAVFPQYFERIYD